MAKFVREQARIGMAMNDEDAVAQRESRHVWPERAGVKDHLAQQQLLDRDGQLVHLKEPHELGCFHPDAMGKCQAPGSQGFAVLGRALGLRFCPSNGL